ncbi:cyclin-dependent kinase 5-like [Oratosquilla oratoria]|uniref:cyclin-dependent kinase 5-like n=1 Tax=Oratosquilla oratoria TaxID=337810 RepID=UPI003F762E0F
MRLKKIQQATSSFISRGSKRMKSVLQRWIGFCIHCASCGCHYASSAPKSNDVRLEEPWSAGPRPYAQSPKDTNLNAAQGNRNEGDMFLFLQLLGRGSYGAVHKVREQNSKQIFAYKLSDIRTTFRRSAFFKEVFALRQLKGHINVVRYVSHDVYSKEGGILMEFVDYNVKELLTLRDKKKFILKASWIKSIVMDLLTAVCHIHSRGIIHFDLKPQNLLITRSGVLKVADFGLSEQRKDRPFKDLKVTQPYRPPECYLCRSLVDSMADLWSCGVILLELVTGQRLVPRSRGRECLRHLASAYGLRGNPYCALCRALREENSPKPRLNNFALHRDRWGSAISLARCLLRCNPKERTEAKTALQNALYFSEKPHPTRPDLVCFEKLQG